MDAPGSFEGITLRLRQSADSVADSIVDEIVATIPSYAAITRASLRRSLLIHIDTAATALTMCDVPDHVKDVSVAAERARTGVPIEHVLLAVRLSFQRLREFVTDAATELGISPSLQLEAVRILWEVNDLASREYAVAHREEDLQMARTAETQRIEFVRELLAGGVHTPAMSMRAASFGLNPGTRYRAFRARPAEGHSASSTLRDIEQWAIGYRVTCVGAVVDGDAVGVVPMTDVPPSGPTVGVGPPADLPRLNESFRIASQLSDVSAEFGRLGPQTIEALSLQIAVAAEHDVGDNLVDRLLGPLVDQGPFGLELIASLDAFLTAGMNTAAAAKLLVVHPNTLRYRINQVTRLTGINLQSAQEISEVWWALRRYEWTTNTGYSP
jgi:hypothetical protein